MNLFAFVVTLNLAYMEPPCNSFDLTCFPSSFCCNHNLEFSYAHEKWLDDMSWSYPEKAEQIALIKAGIEKRREAWLLILEARYITDQEYNLPLNTYLQEEICKKLAEVRKLIGSELYHHRVLPDIIDLSYFVKD